MSLQELLMFIGQFNAFKELNLLRCFKLRESPSSIANWITSKKPKFLKLANPPSTWHHLQLHFNCNFFNIIHNCQVNWVAYSFGGQMEVNPNYFGIHGIFLAPTWSITEF